MVRVGIVMRQTGATAIGGDLVQARAIGRFLRAQGSEVEFVSGHRFVPASWDYAILFNAALVPSTVLASEVCRSQGVPYVIFPVFWDLKSAVPRCHRQALSRVLPAGSVRRRTGARVHFAFSDMSSGELRRSGPVPGTPRRQWGPPVVGCLGARAGSGRAGPVQVPPGGKELAVKSPAGEERRSPPGHSRLDQEPLHRQALGRRLGDDPSLFVGRQAHEHDPRPAARQPAHPAPRPRRPEAWAAPRRRLARRCPRRSEGRTGSDPLSGLHILLPSFWAERLHER